MQYIIQSQKLLLHLQIEFMLYNIYPKEIS